MQDTIDRLMDAKCLRKIFYILNSFLNCCNIWQKSLDGYLKQIVGGFPIEIKTKLIVSDFLCSWLKSDSVTDLSQQKSPQRIFAGLLLHVLTSSVDNKSKKKKKQKTRCSGKAPRKLTPQIQILLKLWKKYLESGLLYNVPFILDHACQERFSNLKKIRF